MNVEAGAVVNYWAVLPAAGVGRRMGGVVPKQYLPLAGRPIIEHTLGRLASHPRIAGVVVALSAEDDHYHYPDRLHGKPLLTVIGGAERCHSVLNALHFLRRTASGGDWALIHDAARPCIRHSDIDHLIDELADHPVGGLLGLPVSDTVKRSDSQGNVVETVSRDGLWRALTPQMFRLDAIIEALEAAERSGAVVTDDAAAMERLGLQPRMVAGHADNIKITHPHDLDLAALYLKQQESEA